ncbi:MAG TPA: DJ-1/PfpI family protein [Thermoanaerobaculia bacterium]|jgi:transcriptional regulator GlxA family with amidase domain|nr:DJ-1/PfpI family protein [Thermoanaerobaculia bacterium]
MLRAALTPKSPLAFVLIPLLLLGLACRPSEREETDSRTTAPAPAAPATPAPAPAPSPAGTDLTGEPTENAPVTANAEGPIPQDRPLRAGFLIVDGVYGTELTAPYDVFQHTTYHTDRGIEVFTVSADGQPVTTAEGLRILPQYSFANAPQIDILVVPSGRGSMDRDLQNQALIDWVKQVGGQARHVLALCDASFVIAKAGLLEGEAATTCPEDYQRFAQAFPNVTLRVNVSFVDEGKILTSQGGARSYEAAMHLVDRLYGRPVATKIGEGLLVPWPPDPDTMSPRVVEPAAAGATAPAPAAPQM